MAKHKYIETPEVWKPIEGYDGYEVSNFGNVRSYRKRNSKVFYEIPHDINPAKTGRDGAYLNFSASNKNKWVKLLVHRCVANAFIKNEENKPEVNHKDKNGHNNYVDNLEWVTSSENHLHAIDERASGYQYVYKNRTTWRAYNKRLGIDRCFKSRKVAVAYAMQYY